jgi:putative redox protein
MTLRMYADFKKISLGKISVDVKHNKVHAKDCQECTQADRDKGGKIDVFERTIRIEGLDDDQMNDKLLEIADKCPVHKTLEKGGAVKTSIEI